MLEGVFDWILLIYCGINIQISWRYKLIGFGTQKGEEAVGVN
jgi:hypothetical protein